MFILEEIYIINKISPTAYHVCITVGDQPGADLGPLISPEAKQRVCELVQSGVDEGASVSD